MNNSKWPAIVFPLLGVAVFGLLIFNEQRQTSAPAPAAVVTKGATPPAAAPPSAAKKTANQAADPATSQGRQPAPAAPAKSAAAPAKPAAPLPQPPAPTSVPAPQPAAGKGEVAVFFAANDMGELVDCGCHKNPLGGLARRVKWISDRARHYAAAAYVDCGGALVADAEVDGDGPGEAASRAAVYLAGIAAAKAIALNVAPAELAVGVKVLRREAKRHGVPLVASNTVDLRSGEPAFKPWVIQQFGSLKIGVIGLSTKRPPQRLRRYTEQGLALTPPVEAAQEVVKDLRGKVDAIVALSWLTRDEIDELGAKVPEIDFVLGAKDSDLTMRPEFLGPGYRLDSYNKGKWLGELRLRAGTATVSSGGQRVAQGHWFDPDLRDRLAYDQGSTQRQIAYYIKKHGEEDQAGGAPDPRARKFEAERLVGLRAKLARVNLELRGVTAPPTGAATFSAKMHAMRTSLPEDPAVTALVKAHHATYPPPPR